jgi:hypothetical protein
MAGNSITPNGLARISHQDIGFGEWWSGFEENGAMCDKEAFRKG